MDPVMHMNSTIMIFMIVLLVIVAAFFIAIRVVGARIQASEESVKKAPTRPELPQ